MQALQWLSAVRLHGCHQPVLTSKYHVSTDSGRANLFYWCVLFISMVMVYLQCMTHVTLRQSVVSDSVVFLSMVNMVMMASSVGLLLFHLQANW